MASLMPSRIPPPQRSQRPRRAAIEAPLFQAGDGSRVEVYNESIRGALQRRLRDEDALREALADDQIVPWYQPLVDMRTGAIVGAEALARWLHPHRGLLLPEEFLPVVPDAGMSVALDEQMIRSSLALRRRLAPMVGPDFTVSANLPTRAESMTAVLNILIDAAHEPGVNVRGSMLEATESSIIADPSASLAALARARAAGFSVALSGAGAGFWSLALERDLPLDVVKLDRSFVRGMATSAADTALVSTVLGLASRLRLRTIAEGVEDDATARRLLDAGIEYAQGFRYGPAIPAEELERWLFSGPPWLVSGPTWR